MEIIWTNEAKRDLYDFWQHSKKTDNTIKNYILNLHRYTECLLVSKELGKKLLKFDDIDIRQLIYKEHKILYYIKENQINIIGVIHFRRDLAAYLRYLKENNAF